MSGQRTLTTFYVFPRGGDSYGRYIDASTRGRAKSLWLADFDLYMPYTEIRARSCGPAVTIPAILPCPAFEWNQAHDVGTPVRYWPGTRDAAPRTGVTRSNAWVMGGHTPAVLVSGYAGGIALTHVVAI